MVNICCLSCLKHEQSSNLGTTENSPEDSLEVPVPFGTFIGNINDDESSPQPEEHKKNTEENKYEENWENVVNEHSEEGLQGKRQRRTRIPDRPNISFKPWNFLKNFLGSDLDKIPIPVNFMEPLSFLQRLAEEFAYSEVLDKAATAKDDYEQMAYVTAFSVSSYASTAVRTTKPFNPLLGETFELDRTHDLGFRCLAEKVIHNPPTVAQYCQSNLHGGWRFWQEFTMESRFTGNYIHVEPRGIAHLLFLSSGNHYTWRKVKTVVNNLVVGKLWLDNYGDMEVVNHRTMDKCFTKFERSSLFSGAKKKVTGTITSQIGEVKWDLFGNWDTRIEGREVDGGEEELETTKLLWENRINDEGAEKYYNFSRFACELNEPEEGTAPTDSRLRPDQRLMEEGRWDEANAEKIRLEEKQRAVRNKRELECETPYTPTWFKPVVDPCNDGEVIHEYQGGYWEAKTTQDWSMCRDIF